MTIEHGHAVAGCRDSQLLLVFESGRLSIDAAENLLCFRLELVLLSRNEGHHVVDNVHAADAGVTSARDSLHGDYRDSIDLAEASLQRGKGNDKPNDGAVAVAHEEALLQAECLLLVGDQAEVVKVDGRDDKGHQGVAAVVLGVGEDGDVCVLELFLDLAGDVAVEAAKHNIAVCELAGLALAHDEVADFGRDGTRLLPSYGITVLLAS